MRADDHTLTSDEYRRICKEAKRVLEESGALGRFPTPVAAVLDFAKITVASDDVLSPGFISKIRHKAGNALKRALSKVLGLLDVKEGLIFIDRSVMAVKQTFLKLHETGHALLKWQRKLYSAVEECEKTIAPEVSELFDREANVFASEVLFQLDHFTKEAADFDFGIKAPLSLSKKYGASIYSTVRRYVGKSDKSCAVVVLDPPKLRKGDGFVASVRRVVTSPSFDKYFGNVRWPLAVTPDDSLGAIVPLNGHRMSRPRPIELQDSNGGKHECIGEAFATPYQVFILLHVKKAITRLSA